MKALVLGALALMTSTSAFATVDGHDRVFLVVQNIQSEEYFIERAPILGCYGLPQGARLAQLTAPYTVPSNIGCGGQTYQDNINALTCAKVVDQKESDDFMSFSELTLDISKCVAKNDAKFVTMVRTAAKLNFPQADRKKEIKLNLIK